MNSCPWIAPILDAPSPRVAWQTLFDKLGSLAMAGSSPVELHHQTVAPDRLLAESAWKLWKAYPVEAPRTSQALRDWWSQPTLHGHAVLILDALSLRELPALLDGAKAHGIAPTSIKVTGSEVPSDTDHFAKALGVPSRGSLENNGAPGSFAFAGDETYTDVLGLPFEDCAGSVPHEPNVFLWHTWLDDLIHLQRKSPDQLYKLAAEALRSAGIWKFVNRLRQGRRLVVTADHGYAVSKLFTTESNFAAVEALRDAFSASRCKPASAPWPHRFMPPIVLTEGGFHVVMGQRKWKIQSGFPDLCHGGLSLLEVAVPFVEFPAL